MKNIRIVYKIIVISIILLIVLMRFNIVNAENEETYTIEFNIENVENPNYNVYLMIPKDYIEYLIQNSNLNIKYNGPVTLKENTFPSLDIKKENVQEELYEDNNIEYVQVLLEPTIENQYKVNVLKSYPEKDMAFRIEEKETDYNYIIYMEENFKIEDNICKIYYNYQEKVATNIQNEKNGIKLWQIILVILIVGIVVFLIYKINKK